MIRARVTPVIFGWAAMGALVAGCADTDKLGQVADAAQSARDAAAPADAAPARDALAADAIADDAAEPRDAGPVDLGPPDAGEADTGETDTGEFDSGEFDAGEFDAGTSSTSWTPETIPPVADTPCTGATYVRWLPVYQRWISITLCSATRYKIAMADVRPGPYYSIGDFAGHGQDHCELVNPAFTIPNEDDITSGGCATCALGPLVNPGNTQPGPPGYSRAWFGNPFVFEPAWPMFNLYTVPWYECGIALP